MGAVAGIATLVFITYFVWCGMGDMVDELRQIWRDESGSPEDTARSKNDTATSRRCRRY